MLSDIPLCCRKLCTYIVLGALFALPTPLRGLQSPPDSTELHNRAQRAQKEFEATHRTLLPIGVGQTGEKCDEYVGRLCLYGSDLGWEPVKEAPLLVSARDSLLGVLEEVGKTPVLTLSWAEDGPSQDGPHFRAVDLDLPPLKAGDYILRLEMELPYRNQVVSNRRITVI